VLIRRIEAHDFRNLEPLSLEPHPRLNVLYGDNAQGKTNFLEAVFLVGGLGTFRRARNADLVRFGKQEAAVRAEVQGAELTRLLEVRLGPGSRRLRADGKAVRSAVDYLGGLSVTTFCPEDLQVPRGSPGARRRLLDQAVAAVWPAYHNLLRDYQKVLRSRNHLLSERAGGGEPELLEVYDHQLCQLGAPLVAARLRYVARLAPRVTRAYDEITHSGVTASLGYGSAPELLEAGEAVVDLSAAMGQLLQRKRAEDLARGRTCAGPHTDDLELSLDGRSTRTFGSQGQLRALVLSLRLAQIEDTHDMLGYYPVLLLDDVSSELDRERSKYLFDFMAKVDCQTFLTTTRLQLIEVEKNRHDFQVLNGLITPA